MLSSVFVSEQNNPKSYGSIFIEILGIGRLGTRERLIKSGKCPYVCLCVNMLGLGAVLKVASQRWGLSQCLVIDFGCKGCEDRCICILFYGQLAVMCMEGLNIEVGWTKNRGWCLGCLAPLYFNQGLGPTSLTCVQLLVSGNDIVLISTWSGGGIRSSECCLNIYSGVASEGGGHGTCNAVA